MATKIQVRRDTAANWTAANPVLASGEPAFETDTKKEKIGDGVTPWNSLPYKATGGGGTGTNGWTPVLAVVADGERRVQQITDWTGGTGTKPAAGKFVGPSGLVDTAAAATDVRGAAGTGGGSLPSGGEVGDVLTKTVEGEEWQNPAGSTFSEAAVRNTTISDFVEPETEPDPDTEPAAPTDATKLSNFLYLLWVWIEWILMLIGFLPKYYNVKRYGAKGDGVADDTDAIEAAMMAAHAGRGGKVYFPNGHYMIKRPLPEWADVTPENPACQIRVPLSSTYNEMCTIQLIGESWTTPQAMIVGSSTATTVSSSGVIIESTVRGVNDPLFGRGAPSVIGSASILDDYGYINFTKFDMHNICVRTNAGSVTTPLPTTMNAVDLSRVAQTEIGSLMIDINIPLGVSQQPDGPVGLIMPFYNNRALCKADTLLICGYDKGVDASEHTFINYLTVAAANVCVRSLDGGHRRHINKMQCEGFRFGIQLQNGAAAEGAGIYVNSYGAEHNTGDKWYDFVADVYCDEYMEGEKVYITHARTTKTNRLHIWGDNANRVSVEFVNGIKVADGFGHRYATNITLDGLGMRNVSMLATYSADADRTISIINPYRGCEFQILMQQNGTGGHALHLPVNSIFADDYAIDTAPNAVTKVTGWYDGTNYRWKSE